MVRVRVRVGVRLSWPSGYNSIMLSGYNADYIAYILPRLVCVCFGLFLLYMSPILDIKYYFFLLIRK